MQCLAASHIHRGVKNSISQLVLRALHGDAREKVKPKERRRRCGCLAGWVLPPRDTAVSD